MKEKCHFCKQEKKLVNSHIVPEGFYSKLYDNKGRTVFSSKSRDILKYVQKGQREYLLCHKCDGDIIGLYDKYGIETIRDRRHISETKFPGHLIWDEINYNKFKLFHLSVLWRAHIAQKMHKGVKLSKKNENKILNYLSTGIAPKENEYPIYGTLLIDPIYDEVCDEIVTNGNCYYRMGTEKKLKAFVFIFGGFAWTYIIPEAGKKDPQKDLFLKESGKMLILKENIRQFKPFLDLYNSVENVKKSNNDK